MTYDGLFQPEIVLDVPSASQTEEDDARCDHAPEPDGRKDHFTTKNGIRCAGTHLIIDLHDADHLDDCAYIEQTLLDCVEAAGATLLHIHLHRFEPNGVSGVAVLAESHISIHSWPENRYAALDVFMCGDARPERCIDVLDSAFSPARLEVNELLRGQGV